jgi:iron uptake system component EfeO
MLPAVAALAVILPLAACTQDAPESGAIDVVASESECTPSRTELSAGVTEFRVSNQGNQATELYVLRPDGSIVSERENIAPGVSAAITVELAAGDYSLRCRPNDSSDGVTTAIKVSGTRPPPPPTPS